MKTPAPRTQDSAEYALLQKKLPQVDSYYDRVHQASWIGRTSGLWAGAAVGGTYGAVVGATLSFLPALLGLGAAPTLTVAATTAAMVAGAGLMLGIAIFADVGVTAAAVAAGFEEKERREKLEKIREKNPQLAATIEANTNPTKQELDKPLSLVETFNRYANLKTMAVGVALGAITGAVFSTNLSTAFTGLLPKAIASEAALATASTATFGMVGALFGLRMSYISNRMMNFAHSVLSGQIFETEKATTPITRQLNHAIELELNSPAITSKSAVAAPSAEIALSSIVHNQAQRSFSLGA